MKDFSINEMSFVMCISDTCIFVKGNIILGLYVDDILIVGRTDVVEEFTVNMQKRFACRVDMNVDEFIGCQMFWSQDKNKVVLHQQRMIGNLENKIKNLIIGYKIKSSSTPFLKGTGIEKRKDDEECMNPGDQKIYRSTVGALLYLTKHSRPDLCNSIRELSKVNKVGTEEHFICLLRVCNWLFENKNYGVELKRSKDENCSWNLEAFSDSDWENCKDSRRSITGYIVFLNRNPISWGSRSQKVVSLASAHSEYTAVTEVRKEVLYMKILMFFLNVKPDLPITIHCDNSGAIFLSNNQESKKSKHLDTKVHFIRNYTEKGIIKVIYVSGDKNYADSFTKSVSKSIMDQNQDYMTPLSGFSDV